MGDPKPGDHSDVASGAQEAQDTVRKLQIKNQRLELKVASNLRGGWA